MKLLQQWRSIPTAIVISFLMFLAAGLADAILAAIYPRFYSDLLFIVIFGVAGVFASVFIYSIGISLSPVKNEWARWTIVVTSIIVGIIYFFPMAAMEGGEYEVACKSFGFTIALASLLFMKGKLLE